METTEALLHRLRLPPLTNSLRRKPLPALRITIPQTHPIVSQMHSNEPPLLSKSFASTSQKLSQIFSDNKRMRKNRENEREILTKRRNGGGIGLANAGLQVITFGIFRVSSLSDFCLHLSLLPASFLIRVLFLCFRLQVFYVVPSTDFLSLSIFCELGFQKGP